jgi:hypothetical protein
MIAFTTRSQRLTETRPLPVGVFEDDALLLRLATRSRFAESGCPRTSGQINADDLALEVARLMECETWEM